VPVWNWLVVFAVLVAAAGMGLNFVPSGQVALVPHDPLDLGGRVRIDGSRPEPVHGKVFLVGVEERKVSLLQKFLLGFDETVSFEVAPTPTAREIQDQENKQAIATSKEIAVAVVLELLNQPVIYTGGGARVTATVPGTPGARLLRTGDRIVRFNGEQVVTAADVTRRVGALSPGSAVSLGVRRDGQPRVVRLSTVAPTGGDERIRSRIGVSVDTPDLKIRPSRDVSFKTENVGGPSAGLAFALVVYDSLSDRDVVRGRHIVATGALTLDGTVAPVGGVREKAIAAQNAGRDLFVVPTANVDEAVRGVQLACGEGQDCTRVLSVENVPQAMELLSLTPSELETRLAN